MSFANTVKDTLARQKWLHENMGGTFPPATRPGDNIQPVFSGDLIPSLTTEGPSQPTSLHYKFGR